ncbi:hypothetical protein [Bacillus cereus]|uniref:hypothetical protein n=1 Tax=Bacillus cereus TaxID=1396 RepID=UPI001643215E|nr:hypothetical protein [Bacillus cereus]
MDITEIFNYLNDLFHDPIQEGLKVFFVGLAYKLLDKNEDYPNKRTVNACKLNDGSKDK